MDIINKLVLLVIPILVCCSFFYSNHKEKSIWVSQELSLIIKNGFSDDITIISSNQDDTQSQIVKPGDSLAIRFTAEIFQVEDKKAKDESIRNIKHRRIEIKKNTMYLFNIGNDFELKIALSDGTKYSYLIEKADGWFEDPPVLERLFVILKDQPLYGIPVN